MLPVGTSKVQKTFTQLYIHTTACTDSKGKAVPDTLWPHITHPAVNRTMLSVHGTPLDHFICDYLTFKGFLHRGAFASFSLTRATHRRHHVILHLCLLCYSLGIRMVWHVSTVETVWHRPMYQVHGNFLGTIEDYDCIRRDFIINMHLIGCEETACQSQDVFVAII